MRKQTTVDVKGESYLLTQFSATQGLKYQKILAKIILPAWAAAAQTSEEKPAMAALLEKVAENLDQLDVGFIKEFILAGSTKNTITIDFDNEFAGEYDKLYMLFFEIVRFNFGNVFTGLGFGE